MTDQSEQINPNGTIFAVQPSTFSDSARVNIGTPYEIAVAHADAMSFYTADNDSGTFVRLAHRVTGRRGEESHQWYFWEATWSPEDYVEPKKRDHDPIADLPDLEHGVEGETFFGALREDLEKGAGESRGKLYATAVVAVATYEQKNNLHIERAAFIDLDDVPDPRCFYDGDGQCVSDGPCMHNERTEA